MKIVNYLRFTLLIFFLSIFVNQISHSYEIKIIKRINGEIITNIDVIKEYQYLLALNKKFESTDKEEILNIAKDSLINEKIKKNEILKKYILGVDNRDLILSIIKNIYLPLGIKNQNEFEIYLKNYELTLQDIYDKIEIEITWNQLIYFKYNNQININEELLREKIRNIKDERVSYNLSEIFILGNTKQKILIRYNELKDYINEFGFKKTALLYSDADSKSKEGLIGWVYEDQLSPIFNQELKKLEIGLITKPLYVSGGAIILKINDLKNEYKDINFEDEFNSAKRFEIEKQLNNFSLIYFNKIKNSLLNE